MHQPNQSVKVYVSGPYTSDPETGTAHAIDVGQKLLEAGYTPYVPHLSHYWHEKHHENSYETWVQLDLEWVKASDILVRMPGVSAGADREVKLAQELGIPVFWWHRKLTAYDAPSLLDEDLDRFASHVLNCRLSMTLGADEQTGSVPQYITEGLNLMRSIFAKKNADYAEGSWDSNFLDVARQMGYEREDACETLIAVKQARLRSLRTNGSLPANEAVSDTVLDRAVYALIALAMHIENGDFDD